LPLAPPPRRFSFLKALTLEFSLGLLLAHFRAHKHEAWTFLSLLDRLGFKNTALIFLPLPFSSERLPLPIPPPLPILYVLAPRRLSDAPLSPYPEWLAVPLLVPFLYPQQVSPPDLFLFLPQRPGHFLFFFSLLTEKWDTCPAHSFGISETMDFSTLH